MAKQLELDLGRPAWHETNFGYALKRDTGRTSITSTTQVGTTDQTRHNNAAEKNSQNWQDQPNAKSTGVAG